MQIRISEAGLMPGGAPTGEKAVPEAGNGLFAGILTGMLSAAPKNAQTVPRIRQFLVEQALNPQVPEGVPQEVQTEPAPEGELPADAEPEKASDRPVPEGRNPVEIPDILTHFPLNARVAKEAGKDHPVRVAQVMLPDTAAGAAVQALNRAVERQQGQTDVVRTKELPVPEVQEQRLETVPGKSGEGTGQMVPEGPKIPAGQTAVPDKTVAAGKEPVTIEPERPETAAVRETMTGSPEIPESGVRKEPVRAEARREAGNPEGFRMTETSPEPDGKPDRTQQVTGTEFRETGRRPLTGKPVEQDVETVTLKETGGTGEPGQQKVDMPVRQVLETAEPERMVNRLAGETGELVVEKMTHLTRGETQVLKVRLRPDSLGSLEIQVKLEAGELAGRILVETSQARELVERQLGNLLRQLEAREIPLTRMEVVQTTEPSGGSANGNWPGTAGQAFQEGTAGGNPWTRQNGWFYHRQTGSSVAELIPEPAKTGPGIDLLA